jgi:acyl-CoA thioester hydrolase
MADGPTYTLAVRVADADIDRQGHVNNVAFVRYVQDAAAAHWNAIAPAEVRAAFAWVVRRHEIEYLRPGSPGDELHVRTWVGEPSGATWDRFTEVLRAGEDRPLVTARTIWVLLDAATGRPRRVDPNLVACFAGPDTGSGTG